MKKKVSFIIPVYNQETLLKRCVRSIPKRDDIEIIIIDDGSTDNTHITIQELIREYPEHVGALICKENHGVSYARNLGIERAVGDYVIFVDSDDYLDTNKTSILIDKYLPTNAWDVVFYNMITNNKMVYRSTRENRATRYGMFKFIRKDFIGDIRFPVGNQYGEDRVFHEEIMKKDPKWVCTDILIYYYNYPREGSLCYIHEKEENKSDKEQCRTENPNFYYEIH